MAKVLINTSTTCRNELDVELAKSTSKTPKTNNIILLSDLDFKMF